MIKEHFKNLAFSIPVTTAILSCIFAFLFAYIHDIEKMDICLLIAFVAGGFSTWVWHIDKEYFAKKGG